MTNDKRKQIDEECRQLHDQIAPQTKPSDWCQHREGFYRAWIGQLEQKKQ